MAISHPMAKKDCIGGLAAVSKVFHLDFQGLLTLDPFPRGCLWQKGKR